MSDDDPVDALYGLPLEEFVGARDELAKAQRADGDRDAAGATKKLAKPSRAAWAVNSAIRENPDEAQALADAAERLREAQEEVMSGGERTVLREATAEARAAVDALVEAAPAEGDAAAQKVRATLNAGVSDPDFLEEVLAGRVTREREAAGFGGFGEMGAVASPPRRSSSSSSSSAKGGGTKKRDAEKKRRAEEEEKKRQAEEERRAEVEERRAEALRAAREREEAAEEAVAEEEKAIAEIEAALHARRDQLHAAERELREARKARKRAEG